MKNNSRNLLFIVDDDPEDRQIILEAFIEIHHEMDYEFMESGEELMNSLDSEDKDYPSLILLDLNMPGMMGLHALKQIRNNKRLSHIPIIVLTTSNLDWDRRISYELGANCFLRKPDQFERLVELADAIIQLWLAP
jgi:CheY-like chemotaxis protein